MQANTYKYSLDKTSKKFICPQCGHKTFVRYKDDTNNYLPPHVGRCDRENRCAHHCPPKQYFGEASPNNNTYHTPNVQPVQAGYIPLQLVNPTLAGVQHTSLVQYLTTLAGATAALHAAELYCIGRSRQDGGRACIFWQADAKGMVRSGKIVAYNAQTGKRIKQAEALANGTGLRDYHNNFIACLSVHPMVKKALGNNSLHLRAGFFGEHLLTVFPGAPVCVVESEKTAVICSMYLPQMVWLATGGANGCAWRRHDVYKALAGRHVTFYPDYGWYNRSKQITCFTEWTLRVQEIAQHLSGTFTVSNELETRLQHLPREDQDLADVLVGRGG